jgi:hypothetical protein
MTDGSPRPEETFVPDDDLPTTDLDDAAADAEKAGETEEYTGVPVTDEELGTVWEAETGDQPS